MQNRCAVVPYEGKQPYVFISYSHKDTKLVFPILERLSQEGYRLWYDDGIDPGAEWPESIAEHLGNAAACIAMITNNYLSSDNCRREMNFALKRQIPLLSVLLEDAEMTAGVEMQLSTNQAIFKHRLPSDDAFMAKVNNTKILQSSRKITEKKPVAAAEAAPAASAPTAAPAPESPRDQRPAESAEKRASKKKWLYVLIAAAAVIVIAAVVFAVTGSSGANDESSRSTVQETSLSEPDEATESYSEAADIAAPETPLNKETLLISSPYAGRVLWGKKTVEEYDDAETFVQRSVYADVALESGTTNLSVLPYAIEVRRDDHPEIVRLYFYDMLGTEHIVQGSYTIRDGMLTISPCEAAFQDAQPLTEALKYQISMGSGALTLQTETDAIPVAKVLSYASRETTLRGAADNAVYKDIRALEILQPGDGADCVLQFTDGGQTNDAKIRMYRHGNLSLGWTQEKRPYNGVMTDTDVYQDCYFDILNTYPYGFLLIDEQNVYFYQQPLPADSD